MSTYSLCRTVGALTLVSLSLAAQTPQQNPVPLKHWTAPKYFQIPRADAAASPTVPLTFIALPPCRLADTRPASGYPALGSTPLTANTSHTLSIAGACGAPTSPVALAYSLNVSVVPPAGTRGGYLTAYPNPASPAPSAASLTWNPGSSYDTNAVAVEASSDGSVNIIVNMSTDVVIDINGYYIAQPSRNTSLVFNANAMSAFPPSAASTTLQTTLGSGATIFPITAWALQPSSSVNLMLTFNIPVDFAPGNSTPLIHVHFLTGPGTAGGVVTLPIFICSVPTGLAGGACFTRYPNVATVADAPSSASAYTFIHYDLTYTLSGYSFAGHVISPGDFFALTLGRSTTDSFSDQIYVTSIEFRYPTN